MKKRTKVIFMIFICCCILVWLYRINIVNYFKESRNVNYNIEEISGVEVLSLAEDFGYQGTIKVDDENDVKDIFSFINRLELVKIKDADYSYDDNGKIYLCIYGKDSYLDTIMFINRYMVVYHNGYDGDYTAYYIKNSKYNFINKKTKITKYMYEILNK